MEYEGTNATGAETFLGNVTIPTAIPDETGFNYTVWVGAPDLSCTYAQAGIQDSAGTWRFTWSFTPLEGSASEGWWGSHLAPGDTYQLVILAGGGEVLASLYNVSHGNFYNSSGTPAHTARLIDGADGLMAGPSFCAGQAVTLESFLQVQSTGGTTPTPGPSRDLFVQDEGLALSSNPFDVLSAPNLWTAFFHDAPSAFAPSQSWSTTDLLSLVSMHPAIVLKTTSAPAANIDVGMTVATDVVAVPRIEDVTANAQTNAYVQTEYDGGYPGSAGSGFATCNSLNATFSSAGDLGGTSGLVGEYGYSVNTSVSDIYWAYRSEPTTNLSLDYECYTEPLTTAGNLTIASMAYLRYGGTNPVWTFVDANTSGPLEQLGMDAWTWTVWVHPLPQVVATVPGTSVETNRTMDFGGWERGGSPTLQYAWYVDGTLQPSCTTLSCPLSWTDPGTHQVWVAVTDGDGARAVSSHLNETVVADLRASLTPAPSALGTVGAPTLLRASLTGGVGGDTYSFWVNGSLSPVQSGPSGSWSFVPTHPSVYQLWVSVNDSEGDTASSPHTNLTVAVGVVVLVTPTSSVIEVGQAPAQLAATVSGGSPPYSITWSYPTAYLSPVGTCYALCNLTGNDPGTYEVQVTAIDSGGTGRTSPIAYANVTVLAPLTFASWSGPPVVDLGNNDSYHALFQGGSRPVDYTWEENGVPLGYCAGDANCSVEVNLFGADKLMVNATDPLGGSATSAPFWLEAVDDLSVGLFPPPAPEGEVGVAYDLGALATNGAGGTTYGFLTSVDPAVPLCLGRASSCVWTPSVASTTQVWVEANDSTGFRNVSAHANVTVLPSLSVAISPAPIGAVSAGEALNVSATPSGGLGPFSYTWYSDGTAETDCSSNFCSFRWSSAGLEEVWVSVRDDLGGEAPSPHTNVTVGAGVRSLVTFEVGPTGAGTITVNGASVESGNVTSLFSGSYALTASPSPGWYFEGWATLGAASALSLADASEATTSLEVSGSGIVLAEFTSPSIYSVSFQASPSATANATLNGTALAAGGSLPLRAGVYPVEGLPGPGRAFLGWQTTGGLSVASNEQTSFLEVESSGILTAETSPASGVGHGLYEVELLSQPSSSGATFTIGSTTYASGDTVDLVQGSYTLSVALPSGEGFLSYHVSGGVAVSSASASSTELEVTGNGTLTVEVSTSGSSALPFGLTISTIEFLGALLLILVVIVAIGVARHRAHERAHPRFIPPHPSSAYSSGSENSLEETPGEDELGET